MKKKSVPPIEHRFKPGVSGNPEGSRAHDPVKKALKKLTVESFKEIIQIILTGNVSDLIRLAQNPKTPTLQVGIAKAVANAIEAGDYPTIERIVERLVGKIPEELNVTATTKNLNANLNASLDPAKVRDAMIALEKDV